MVLVGTREYFLLLGLLSEHWDAVHAVHHIHAAGCAGWHCLLVGTAYPAIAVFLSCYRQYSMLHFILNCVLVLGEQLAQSQ